MSLSLMRDPFSARAGGTLRILFLWISWQGGSKPWQQEVPSNATERTPNPLTLRVSILLGTVGDFLQSPCEFSFYTHFCSKVIIFRPGEDHHIVTHASFMTKLKDSHCSVGHVTQNVLHSANGTFWWQSLLDDSEPSGIAASCRYWFGILSPLRMS